MIGGYLLGQLSEVFYRNTASSYSFLLDIFYCIVPDLNSEGYQMGLGSFLEQGAVNVYFQGVLSILILLILVSFGIRKAASSKLH